MILRYEFSLIFNSTLYVLLCKQIEVYTEFNITNIIECSIGGKNWKNIAILHYYIFS